MTAAVAWLEALVHSIPLPVLEVWERTLALSTPVLAPGEQPPLTRRQVEVARLLAIGAKDQSIARQLRKTEKISIAFPRRNPQFRHGRNCYTFETFAERCRVFPHASTASTTN